MPREPSRGASRSGAPPAGVAPRRSGAPREAFPVQAAVAALVAFPFVVALAGWLMTGGRLGVVATSLVAGLPAVIVASLLLLHEHRRGSRAEASLEGVEARLRGIVYSAMDAIITVDPSQRIVLFNADAERMFLLTQEQAIGATLAWLLPRALSRHPRRVRARCSGKSGSRLRPMGGGAYSCPSFPATSRNSRSNPLFSRIF